MMELELALKRHSGEAARAYLTQLLGGSVREAIEGGEGPLIDNADHSIEKVGHTGGREGGERKVGADGSAWCVGLWGSAGVRRLARRHTSTPHDNDNTTGHPLSLLLALLWLPVAVTLCVVCGVCVGSVPVCCCLVCCSPSCSPTPPLPPNSW